MWATLIARKWAQSSKQKYSSWRTWAWTSARACNLIFIGFSSHFEFYFSVGKEGNVLACAQGQWWVLPLRFCLIPRQGYLALLCRALSRIKQSWLKLQLEFEGFFFPALWIKKRTEYEFSRCSVAKIHKWWVSVFRLRSRDESLNLSFVLWDKRA